MKAKFYLALTALTILLSTNTKAQNTFPSTGRVGIGTTSPNASSLLEVKSTNKGVLIPRMTQAQRDAIGTPANGLLIYQTDNNPGFFYYAGSTWVGVQQKGKLWSLTGNQGTTPGSNYLGTSDAKDLVIKTNATERMRVKTNGYVGIGTTAAAAKLHVDGGSYLSLSSPGYQIIGNTGSYNIALDPYTIQARYNGSYSTLYLNDYGGTVYLGSSSNSYYGAIGYGSSYGLYGYASGSTATGVYGSSYYGIYGSGTYGVYGTGSYIGVRGTTSTGYGGYFTATGSGGYGSYSYSTNSIAVYGYTGNSSSNYAGYFVGNVYCSGTYFGSDQKLKENITDVSSAMDIINQLHPKYYNYRQDGDYKLMNLPSGKHYGLIAQDVEKVLPNLVKESKFNTGDTKAGLSAQPAANGNKDSINTRDMDKQSVEAKSSNKEIDFKAVNYTELIPIIIKGMQEQEATIAKQQQQISDLRQQLAALSGNTTSAAAATSLSSASLSQNVPNPTKNSTSIQYNLPAKFSSAQIVVTDNTGRTLKQLAVSGQGKGSVNVNTSGLAAGTYNYSLYVDGRLIDTKQMMLAK